MLALQGVVIVLPEPGSSVDCDVAVYDVEGVMLDVRVRSSSVVLEANAWKALFKALSHPHGFSHVRVGLDPGVLCSIAVYADSLLVWVEKMECSSVAKRVKWLIEVIEPRSYTINVGSGPGCHEVLEGMLREGLEARIVSEEATSSKPILSRLADEVGDRDILAAMTIALAY